MTATMTLLDELQRRGFTPNHDELADRYDLDIGGFGALSVPRSRVRVCPAEGEVIVYVLTGNGVVLWYARLTGSTPLNVVTAVIDLAIAYAVTSGECE